MSINNTAVNKGIPGYVWAISFVAALGGFLFGFETGVVSGLIDAIRAKYELIPASEGFFVSAAVLGCIVGAPCAGFLADRFGRKKVLFLSGVLFFLSGLGCGYPINFAALVIFRALGGIGVGIASVVAPLYISEIAPTKIRGRLVVLFQLAVVFGLFSSYASNALIDLCSKRFADLFTLPALSFIFVEESWRAMFLALCIPAAIYSILSFFIPESPRWSLLRGQPETAKRVLDKFLGPEDAAREMEEIRNSCRMEQGRFAELFESGVRFRLLIAAVLMFFSQVTGVNVIMYFGKEVFTESGFSSDFSFWLQVIVGVANIGFTFLAIAKIDQWGRKTLLKIGTVSLLAILLLLTILFSTKPYWTGNTAVLWLLPVLIVFFIAAFAMSWGAVPWVVVSEIFPNRIRGRAASIGTMVIWISCFLVVQTFPMLKEFGAEICFGLYSFFMVLALVFVCRFMPETKGRSLEEIEGELYAATDSKK